MIEAAQARLRQLTDDHARGELDFSEYRRQRGELLDGLLAMPSEPPLADAALRVRSRAGLYVCYLLGVVTLGALMWLGTERRDLLASTWHALTPAGVGALESNSDTGSAQALIERFLRERDWSESRVADFHRSWRALPESARAAARSASWRHEIADVIRLRIKEQRALASPRDQAPLSPALSGIAQEFGVDVDTAVSAERIHSARQE